MSGRKRLGVYCIARNEAMQMPTWVNNALTVNPDEILIGIDSRSDEETREAAFALSADIPIVRVVSWTLPQDLNDDERARAEWFGIIEELTHLSSSKFKEKLNLPDEPAEREKFFQSVIHHFSAARNVTLRHSTCHWNLQVDCDERVLPGLAQPLHQAIEDADAQDVELLCVPILILDDAGEVRQRFMGERLIKRGALYHDAVHNWVNTTKRRSLPFDVLVHSRTARPREYRHQRDRQRMINGFGYFTWRVKNNPQDSRALFYLGQALVDLGERDEAIHVFRQYVDATPPCEERAQVLIHLAQQLAGKEQLREAEEMLAMAALDNYRRPEVYCALGDIAADKNETAKAEFYYKVAMMAEPSDIEMMFVDRRAATFLPPASLWDLYRLQKRDEEARQMRKLAYQAGIPPRESKRMEFHTVPMRLAVFVDRADDKFILPLIQELGKRGVLAEVKMTAEPDDALMEWADVAWFEWAGELLAEMTRRAKRCRIIARLHGYECYSDVIDRVVWDKVDDVIFVADYLRRFVEERSPGFAEAPRVFVAPGGVDTETFHISKDAARDGTKFCFAGYLNAKKQPQWMLTLLAAARRLMPLATLHVCGRWQDARVQKHWNTLIAEMGLKDAVTFYDWMPQERLAQWYQDKDYFISCSYDESLHYACAEAMACGVKPLVHCWESARDFYPPDLIWRTEAEFIEKIGVSYPAAACRQWVVERLSLDRNARRIERILAKPNVSVVGAQWTDWGIAAKVTVALEELGYCVTPPSDAKRHLVFIGKQPVEADTLEGEALFWSAELLWGKSAVAGHGQDAIAQSKLPERIQTIQSVRDFYLGGVCYPFQRLPGVVKDIDVLFCGNINERREEWLKFLRQKGINVVVAQTFNHSEMNALMNRSKIVLNLHFTDDLNVETRVGEALGAGAFLLSETLMTPNSISDVTDMIPQFATKKECVQAIRRYLASDAEREKIADKLYRYAQRRLTLAGQVEKVMDWWEAQHEKERKKVVLVQQPENVDKA